MPKKPGGSRPRPASDTEVLDPERHSQVCESLRRASAKSCDLIPRGSNYTFLVKLSLDNRDIGHGIYKPRKGENPLRDFPAGTLFKREYAAYLLSEALGWRFVPPTVIWNGPHGTGSLQLFIHAEPRVTYFELREPHPQEVKRIAAFDLIANNADRKGGHCIKDLNGKVWGIDHGLTFSVEHKLRTVIWDFGGDPIPQETLDEIARELARFHIPGGLSHTLKGVLFDEEIESLALRMQEVLHNPVFPEIQARWDVPWPLI